MFCFFLYQEDSEWQDIADSLISGLKNLPDGGVLALPNYPLKQAIGAIEVSDIRGRETNIQEAKITSYSIGKFISLWMREWMQECFH